MKKTILTLAFTFIVAFAFSQNSTPQPAVSSKAKTAEPVQKTTMDNATENSMDKSAAKPAQSNPDMSPAPIVQPAHAAPPAPEGQPMQPAKKSKKEANSVKEAPKN